MKKKVIGKYLRGHNGWKLPYNLFREIRAFYHRGMYGYASCDLWSLNDYLADWMPSALKELKDAPIDWSYNEVNFDLMLDGFKAYEESIDSEVGQKSFEEFDREQNAFEARQDAGLKHFAEKFSFLWW